MEEPLTAGAGYCTRRGLWTDPEHVVFCPGAAAALRALIAAVEGDVIVARPAAMYHADVPGELGRRTRAVATPAEGGGAPDPFALLETVRRGRAAGESPGVLVMSAAGDPTGTVTPPELLHETCEAAAECGLLVISDESYDETVHHPHTTVLLSPAEMLPERTIVLRDLGMSLLPGESVALVRFPGTPEGTELRVRAVRASGPVPEPLLAAAAHVLSEPEDVRERIAATTGRHAETARALHRAVTEAGATCLPPEVGSHLYPDLGALRPGLEKHGVYDAPTLERHLEAFGALGGHRFGDDPHALRVRLDAARMWGGGTTLENTLGTTEALTQFTSALTALTAG